MTVLTDAELMTTVEWWRELSPEEQEAILWNFEQEYDAETAGGARALLRNKKSVEVDVVVPLEDGWKFVKRADCSRWRVRGRDWRRWLGADPKSNEARQSVEGEKKGVVQLKVV